VAVGRHVTGPGLAIVIAELEPFGGVRIPIGTVNGSFGGRIRVHVGDASCARGVVGLIPLASRWMEIVLVRHGEPEWVIDGLNIDHPRLTERGRRQAAHMAEALAGEEFDEILVSPLERARETAAPLYGRYGRDQVIEPWLTEIRSPVWQGTPREKADVAFAEERRRPSVERWNGLADLGGEPNRDFIARIRSGCQNFLAERGIVRIGGALPVWQIEAPDMRVCLVAHAGTNSAVISYLLGLEPTPWEWDRFVLGHASITRLEALQLGDGFTFALTRLADVEHLATTDRTR
jgi:probable phosphoglycerate mutase